MISHRIWKISAALVGLAVVLCACAKREIAEPDGGAEYARLAAFTLSADGPEDMLRPRLFHAGREFTEDIGTVRDISADPLARDFPAPGCETLKAQMFTGGANCCYAYYILTSCPSGDYAAFVDPQDGGLGEALNSPGRVYPADEPAFMYYSPENQPENKARLSFDRPGSPRPTRYLVFEKGAWRPDAVGEFRAAYKALEAETLRNTELSPAAKAIYAAYYGLMSGASRDVTAKKLKLALPREYRHLSDIVFADVEKAVADFSPVRNIDLRAR